MEIILEGKDKKILKSLTSPDYPRGYRVTLLMHLGFGILTKEMEERVV